jgi:hypothetical protein
MRNLSSLFYGADRLERELKRTGVLTEPAPPLSDQEQAEHDRLTALVDAHATENEKATLALSATSGGYLKLGWRLTDLAAAVVGEDLERPLPPFEWDPAALAEITARIELRRELRLPFRECVVRKPPPEAAYCICLSQAVDALIASGEPMTRDQVLRAARQSHNESWAWLKRKPEPRPELPASAPSPLPAPKRKPQPAPPRELVSQTNTRPAQIVRRRKRWYDVDTPRPSDFRDMQF